MAKDNDASETLNSFVCLFKIRQVCVDINYFAYYHLHNVTYMINSSSLTRCQKYVGQKHSNHQIYMYQHFCTVQGGLFPAKVTNA